jgi:hypothetical protein
MNFRAPMSHASARALGLRVRWYERDVPSRYPSSGVTERNPTGEGVVVSRKVQPIPTWRKGGE